MSGSYDLNISSVNCFIHYVSKDIGGLISAKLPVTDISFGAQHWRHLGDTTFFHYQEGAMFKDIT